MKRYHKEIFFEVGVMDEINALIKNMELHPTKHFIDNWVKRGKVCIPTKQIIESGEVFEYYRDEKTGLIEKFVVRCKGFNVGYDIIFVLNNRGGIVTSWINDKNNNHSNLQKSLYEDGKSCSHKGKRKRINKCEKLIMEWKKRQKYSISTKRSWFK